MTCSVNESMVKLENGVGPGMLLIDVYFGSFLRLFYIVEWEVPPGFLYTLFSLHQSEDTCKSIFNICSSRVRGNKI